MHKATIVWRSEISGEHISVVKHDDLVIFLAEVTGSIQGITAAGSVVTSLVTEKVEAA